MTLYDPRPEAADRPVAVLAGQEHQQQQQEEEEEEITNSNVAGALDW